MPKEPLRLVEEDLNLADEFTKAAMQGMISKFHISNETIPIDDIAKVSYETAEAMLRARQEFTDSIMSEAE